VRVKVKFVGVLIGLSAAVFALPMMAFAAQLHGDPASFASPGSSAGQLRLNGPDFQVESTDGGSDIAVNDQTHDLYVADTLNNRVSEFTSAGAPISSWGWGVLDGSPKLQLCTTVCQAGLAGDEPGQFAQPLLIAVDNDPGPSSGDVYVGGVGRQARDERQYVKYGTGHLGGEFEGITGGTFTLTFEGQTTPPIPYDALAATVQGDLEALSPIGVGNVRVVEVRGHFLLVEFQGALKETNVPQLEVDSSGLLPAGAFIGVETRIDGSALAPEFITKFDSSGNLIESWGTDGQLSAANTPGHPLAAAAAITVEGSGNLLVLQEGGILEFDQASNFVRKIEGIFTAPGGIAVDNAGNIYFTGSLAVEKLAPNGTSLGNVTQASNQGGSRITGLAASNPGSGIYVGQNGATIAQVPPGCEPVPNGFSTSCIPSQVFGEGQLRDGFGLAVDSSTGTVYGASTEDDRIVAFPLVLESTIEAAAAIEATTAILHGTVDPKGGSVVGCRFQYGTSTEYGTEAPCLNAVGEEVGTPAHPTTTTTALHADVTGLAGGTKYHFRLRVSNAKPEYLSSEDEELITKELASVESTTASEITGNSATLNASINPNGVATTRYRFEWGPCSSASACATSPFPEVGPEASLTPGSSLVAVSEPISGLDPATTYHFRVFVSDANGTVTGPEAVFAFLPQLQIEHGCGNEALRTENASTQLPDCRSYELVTPMAKNASLIGALFANNIPPQIANDGSRVIAPAIQCFANSGSCVATRQSEGEPFRFERTASGWQASSLALSASVFRTSSYWGFNADSGTALFSSPSPPNDQDDFYVRSPGGPVGALGPVSEGPTNVLGVTGESLVATADLSHVAFPASQPLWSFDKGGTNSLYEYPGPEGSTSEPQLVAVSGGPGSHELIGRCSSSIAGVETRAQSFGTLSSDGSTTYFQVAKCAAGVGPINEHLEVPVFELYARVDGDGPEARTVAISEPRAPQVPPQDNPACTSADCLTNTDPTKSQNFRDAEFTGASENGRLAYFLSPQQLTDGATQDPNSADTAFAGGCTHTTGADGCNLYLYEDPQHQSPGVPHLIDVSAGDTSGIGPEVQGMFALSTDGSHAYFVAKGVLTEGPNAQGERAGEGADNLYVYERDGARPEGRTRFITRLAASFPQWNNGLEFANTTPDGRYLVFESGRGLTADARPSGPRQIYRYDAQTGRLGRVSFGLGGFDADGNGAGAGANATVVPLSSTTTFRAGPARSDPTMSDDGAVVFFQSPVALVPGALSEVPLAEERLAQNIYEWEEQGHGGCAEPRGCISLLSDGTDTANGSKTIPNATELLGTDASGENVFFATSSQLNWADTDTQRDYYDARVGGGFPQAPESQVCKGDACKGQGTGAGEQAAPATPNVNGPGNVKARPKCKKGQVRKGGRCVKRPRQQKHKKKSHKHKKNQHQKNGKNQDKKKRGTGR
jgi:hypothetical protein